MRNHAEGKLTLRGYKSQAAALVLVVRTYPDTRARLDEVTRK